MSSPKDRLQRVFSRVALVLSFGVIALSTLTPSDWSGRGWTCVFCGTFALADAILNVLLFVPLGISLRLVSVTAIRAFAVGVLTTLAVESSQFLVIPGRDASIGDLISNTLGCGLGYLIAARANAWLFPGPRQSSRISLAYAGGLLGMVCGTAILLKPSFADAAYYGDWTPNPNRVLDVSIGSFELPPHRLEHSASVRDAWFAGTPVKVRAVVGPKTPALESLFSIHDENRRDILLLGRIHDDLVFRYRMRAGGMRLHQPLLRLPGAIQGIAEGDTISVSVGRDGQRHCLVLNQTGYCNLGFTAGTGWAFLMRSVSMSNPSKALLNMAWLAGLLMPLGFWIRTQADAVIGGLLALLTLFLVPRLAGLLPTAPIEWAGAGFGIGFGLLLQLGFRRIQPRFTDSENARDTDADISASSASH